jgi:hypothetical protein
VTVGYYRRGYYRSQAGDYFRGPRGGGIADFIAKLPGYASTGLSVLQSIGGTMPNLAQPAMQFSPTDLGMTAPGSTVSMGAPTAARGSRGVTRIAGLGRRYRRMNPGNFRALKRSMRRLKHFQHAARAVYHFTQPAKHTSHFKFGKKRRK